MEPLNPFLRRLNAQRAREYIADAEYHEGRARALRARAAIIAETWQLDPEDDYAPLDA